MTITEHIFAEFVDYIHHPAHKKSEYDSLSEAYSNAADRLLSTLTTEQKSAVFELEAQRNLLAAMDEELMFCEGFRIGAELILDLLRPAP